MYFLIWITTEGNEDKINNDCDRYILKYAELYQLSWLERDISNVEVRDSNPR